jgi:hypothetical protein
MAAGDPIPPETIIYRALPGRKYLAEDSTAPSEVAFLLKPAHDQWPDETYLSLGISVAGAAKGLTNVRHTCAIRVADIVGLNRNLTITEDEDPDKVRVSGMPLITQNEKVALDVAKDLLGISKMCP